MNTTSSVCPHHVSILAGWYIWTQGPGTSHIFYPISSVAAAHLMFSTTGLENDVTSLCSTVLQATFCACHLCCRSSPSMLPCIHTGNPQIHAQAHSLAATHPPFMACCA